MGTKIIIASVLIFLGGIQFAIGLFASCKSEDIKVIRQNKALKSWGNRAILFSAVMAIVLFIKEDFIFIIIVFLFLSAYNTMLLKKAIKG